MVRGGLLRNYLRGPEGCAEAHLLRAAVGCERHARLAGRPQGLVRRPPAHPQQPIEPPSEPPSRPLEPRRKMERLPVPLINHGVTPCVPRLCAIFAGVWTRCRRA